ncbi:MAG: hypothetical protein LUQ40_04895 [Methanomicrobiales archaeon]|nr:hypothetical protein [Methanomicrobiales archaeon]
MRTEAKPAKEHRIIPYGGVLLVLVSMSVLAAACSSGMHAQTVTIVEDFADYSLMMSKAPGMPLSAVVNESPSEGSFVCHWQTDYGEFLSWAAPDFQVRLMGSDVSGNCTKVYWTYFSRADDLTRPDVHIRLDVVNAVTGKPIGSASRIIVWTEGDMAHINPGR